MLGRKEGKGAPAMQHCSQTRPVNAFLSCRPVTHARPVPQRGVLSAERVGHEAPCRVLTLPGRTADGDDDRADADGGAHGAPGRRYGRASREDLAPQDCPRPSVGGLFSRPLAVPHAVAIVYTVADRRARRHAQGGVGVRGEPWYLRLTAVAEWQRRPSGHAEITPGGGATVDVQAHRGDDASAGQAGCDQEDRAPLGLLVGGAAALALAMGIGRFAYTPILPAMARAAHLDTQQAGLLASANYVGYLVGALTLSIGAGRIGRKGLLLGALLVVVLTTAVMASTTHRAAWALIRFAAGIASAGVFVLASGTVLDTLRQRRQTALSGWLYGGVGAGIVLSGLVVQVAGGALGWRGDWLVLAGLAAVAVYPAWRGLRMPRAGRGDPPRGPQGPARGTRVALVLLVLAYLLEGTGYIVTGTFLVSIVERNPALAGRGPSVWIVVGVAGTPSGVLWSALAARLDYARALALAYTLQAGGIALPLLGGVGAALGAAVLFGGTFMGISTLTLTLAGRLVGGQSARIVGLLTAVYGVGQVSGPVLAGILVGQAHDFSPALWAATALVVLGGLLMAAAQPFVPPSARTRPAGRAAR